MKTITLRLSVKNKPVHEILKKLAADKDISTNMLIESILVSYVRDIRGITWDVPAKLKDNRLDLADEIKKITGV